jgi:hypothetical protein
MRRPARSPRFLPGAAAVAAALFVSALAAPSAPRRNVDILVKDGRIEQVGPGLAAPDITLLERPSVVVKGGRVVRDSR